MSETEALDASDIYKPGQIVWVKISGMWWPAEVQDQATLDPEITEGLKKAPLAVVKYLNEDTYDHVKSLDNIYHYNCKRKMEFLKHGFKKYSQHRHERNMSIFPDVIKEAEKLTNGDPSIVDDPEFQVVSAPETPLRGKPENKPTERSAKSSKKKSPVEVKAGGSDASEKSTRPSLHNVIELVGSLGPPKEPSKTSSSMKCFHCDFSSSDLSILLCHYEFYEHSVASQASKKKTPKVKKDKKRKPETPALVNTDKKRKSGVPSVKVPLKEEDKTPTTPALVPATPVNPACNDILKDWDEEEDNDMETKSLPSEPEEVKPATVSETTKPTENQTRTQPQKSPSCFDFDDEEPLDIDLQPVKFGQKLPRLITPEKSKITVTVEGQEDFESLMDEISVPILPEVPRVRGAGGSTENGKTDRSEPSNEDSDEITGKKSFLAKGPLQSQKRKCSGYIEGAEDGSAISKKVKTVEEPSNKENVTTNSVAKAFDGDEANLSSKPTDDVTSPQDEAVLSDSTPAAKKETLDKSSKRSAKLDKSPAVGVRRSSRLPSQSVEESKSPSNSSKATASAKKESTSKAKLNLETVFKEETPEGDSVEGDLLAGSLGDSEEPVPGGEDVDSSVSSEKDTKETSKTTRAARRGRSKSRDTVETKPSDAVEPEENIGEDEASSTGEQVHDKISVKEQEPSKTASRSQRRNSQLIDKNELTPTETSEVVPTDTKRTERRGRSSSHNLTVEKDLTEPKSRTQKLPSSQKKPSNASKNDDIDVAPSKTKEKNTEVSSVDARPSKTSVKESKDRTAQGKDVEKSSDEQHTKTERRGRSLRASACPMNEVEDEEVISPKQAHIQDSDKDSLLETQKDVRRSSRAKSKGPEPNDSKAVESTAVLEDKETEVEDEQEKSELESSPEKRARNLRSSGSVGGKPVGNEEVKESEATEQIDKSKSKQQEESTDEILSSDSPENAKPKEKLSRSDRAARRSSQMKESADVERLGEIPEVVDKQSSVLSTVKEKLSSEEILSPDSLESAKKPEEKLSRSDRAARRSLQIKESADVERLGEISMAVNKQSSVLIPVKEEILSSDSLESAKKPEEKLSRSDRASRRSLQVKESVEVEGLGQVPQVVDKQNSDQTSVKEKISPDEILSSDSPESAKKPEEKLSRSDRASRRSLQVKESVEVQGLGQVPQVVDKQNSDQTSVKEKISPDEILSSDSQESAQKPKEILSRSDRAARKSSHIKKSVEVEGLEEVPEAVDKKSSDLRSVKEKLPSDEILSSDSLESVKKPKENLSRSDRVARQSSLIKKSVVVEGFGEVPESSDLSSVNEKLPSDEILSSGSLESAKKPKENLSRSDRAARKSSQIKKTEDVEGLAKVPEAVAKQSSDLSSVNEKLSRSERAARKSQMKESVDDDVLKEVPEAADNESCDMSLGSLQIAKKPEEKPSRSDRAARKSSHIKKSEVVEGLEELPETVDKPSGELSSVKEKLSRSERAARKSSQIKESVEVEEIEKVPESTDLISVKEKLPSDEIPSSDSLEGTKKPEEKLARSDRTARKSSHVKKSVDVEGLQELPESRGLSSVKEKLSSDEIPSSDSLESIKKLEEKLARSDRAARKSSHVMKSVDVEGLGDLPKAVEKQSRDLSSMKEKHSSKRLESESMKKVSSEKANQLTNESTAVEKPADSKPSKIEHTLGGSKEKSLSTSGEESSNRLRSLRSSVSVEREIHADKTSSEPEDSTKSKDDKLSPRWSRSRWDERKTETASVTPATSAAVLPPSESIPGASEVSAVQSDTIEQPARKSEPRKSLHPVSDESPSASSEFTKQEAEKVDSSPTHKKKSGGSSGEKGQEKPKEEGIAADPLNSRAKPLKQENDVKISKEKDVTKKSDRISRTIVEGATKESKGGSLSSSIGDDSTKFELAKSRKKTKIDESSTDRFDGKTKQKSEELNDKTIESDAVVAQSLTQVVQLPPAEVRKPQDLKSEPPRETTKRRDTVEKKKEASFLPPLDDIVPIPSVEKPKKVEKLKETSKSINELSPQSAKLGKTSRSSLERSSHEESERSPKKTSKEKSKVGLSSKTVPSKTSEVVPPKPLVDSKPTQPKTDLSSKQSDTSSEKVENSLKSSKSEKLSSFKELLMGSPIVGKPRRSSSLKSSDEKSNSDSDNSSKFSAEVKIPLSILKSPESKKAEADIKNKARVKFDEGGVSVKPAGALTFEEALLMGETKMMDKSKKSRSSKSTKLPKPSKKLMEPAKPPSRTESDGGVSNESSKVSDVFVQPISTSQIESPTKSEEIPQNKVISDATSSEKVMDHLEVLSSEAGKEISVKVDVETPQKVDAGGDDVLPCPNFFKETFTSPSRRTSSPAKSSERSLTLPPVLAELNLGPNVMNLKLSPKIQRQVLGLVDERVNVNVDSPSPPKKSRWDNPNPCKRSGSRPTTPTQFLSTGSPKVQTSPNRIKVEIKSGLGRNYFKSGPTDSSSSLPESDELKGESPTKTGHLSNTEDDSEIDELSALKAEMLSYSLGNDQPPSSPRLKALKPNKPQIESSREKETLKDLQSPLTTDEDELGREEVNEVIVEPEPPSSPPPPVSPTIHQQIPRPDPPSEIIALEKRPQPVVASSPLGTVKAHVAPLLEVPDVPIPESDKIYVETCIKRPPLICKTGPKNLPPNLFINSNDGDEEGGSGICVLSSHYMGNSSSSQTIGGLDPSSMELDINSMPIVFDENFMNEDESYVCSAPAAPTTETNESNEAKSELSVTQTQPSQEPSNEESNVDVIDGRKHISARKCCQVFIELISQDDPRFSNLSSLPDYTIPKSSEFPVVMEETSQSAKPESLPSNPVEATETVLSTNSIAPPVKPVEAAPSSPKFGWLAKKNQRLVITQTAQGNKRLKIISHCVPLKPGVRSNPNVLIAAANPRKAGGEKCTTGSSVQTQPKIVPVRQLVSLTGKRVPSSGITRKVIGRPTITAAPVVNVITNNASSTAINVKLSSAGKAKEDILAKALADTDLETDDALPTADVIMSPSTPSAQVFFTSAISNSTSLTDQGIR